MNEEGLRQHRHTPHTRAKRMGGIGILPIVSTHKRPARRRLANDSGHGIICFREIFSEVRRRHRGGPTWQPEMVLRGGTTEPRVAVKVAVSDMPVAGDDEMAQTILLITALASAEQIKVGGSSGNWRQVEADENRMTSPPPGM